MKNYKRNKWVFKYNGQEISIPEWVEFRLSRIIVYRFKSVDSEVGEILLEYMKLYAEAVSCGNYYFIAHDRIAERYGYELVKTFQVDNNMLVFTLVKNEVEPRISEAYYTTNYTGSFTVNSRPVFRTPEPVPDTGGVLVRALNTVRSWMS